MLQLNNSHIHNTFWFVTVYYNIDNKAVVDFINLYGGVGRGTNAKAIPATSSVQTWKKKGGYPFDPKIVLLAIYPLRSIHRENIYPIEKIVIITFNTMYVLSIQIFERV